MTRRTRPMRHARTPVSTGPSRRLTRRGVTVGAVIGLTLSALPAWAYWTSSTSTSASAAATSLQPPATATASATGMTSTQIKVTAAPTTGPTPTGYKITRGGTTVCANVSLNTACNDTNLAPGTAYTYAATSLLQTNWFSAGSTTVSTTTGLFPAPTFSSDTGTQGDGITNDTSLTFAGSAPSSASVTILVDGAPLASSQGNPNPFSANASGTWSYTASSTAISRNVNHTVTARFSNTAGTHVSAGLPLLIDTQPPSTGTATFSCTGATVSGYCKDGITTVSLSGVSDPAPGSGVASLTYSIAGGASGTVTVAAGAGSFSYSTPDGSPAITLTATDGAGNQATGTVTPPLPMDNVGPTVTGITLTDNGDSSRAQAGDTLTIAFSDLGSGVNPQTFCSSWTTTGTSQSISGNNVVNVTIADGGTNDTLTVTAPSACSPGLAIGSVALGANYLTGTSLTFNGTGANASRVTWSGQSGNRSGTLTITLGTQQTGSTSSGVSGQPVYTASPSIKDAVGHAVTNSPYTGGSGRL